MADKVLYFPHIRVPDNDWFTRALLYWDAVGTIVPHAPPDEVRQILGEHTCGLIDAGLVEEIRAGDAIEVPRFDEAFIEMMEADPQIPGSGLETATQKTFQLHMTKPGGRSMRTYGIAISYDEIPMRMTGLMWKSTLRTY